MIFHREKFSRVGREMFLDRIFIAFPKAYKIVEKH